ncbi:class I SAM-dependent methyltransferase [[Eubacterium] cellulosolvens]
MPHIFNARNKKNLNGEERLSISEPFSILSHSGLKNGMNLIDLGCGTGYYTIPTSQILKNGLIYAIDIQTEMLETLHKKLKKISTKNIHIIRSELHNLPIKCESLDIALLINALHELHNKQSILEEICRILKDNGKISVVDWKKTDMQEKIGPPLQERINIIQAQRIFENQYFKLIKRYSVGPHHYGLLFTKKKMP